MRIWHVTAASSGSSPMPHFWNMCLADATTRTSTYASLILTTSTFSVFKRAIPQPHCKILEALAKTILGVMYCCSESWQHVGFKLITWDCLLCHYLASYTQDTVMKMPVWIDMFPGLLHYGYNKENSDTQMCIWSFFKNNTSSGLVLACTWGQKFSSWKRKKNIFISKQINK